MKHLKAANQKAELVEKVQAVEEDVVGMAMPGGCTTVFNPGWEANMWGGRSEERRVGKECRL